MSSARYNSNQPKAPHTRAAPSHYRPIAGPRRWLIIMAKQPVMGAVKTRLAREVGAAEATRFYRNSVRTVVGRLGADPRWRTVLAIAPDTGVGAPVWPSRRPGGIARMAQGLGDLGQRMQRLLASPPAGPVVLVGTDIPSIGPAHIARAFALLGNHDAVLGPAEDGGYWLVGLKRCPRTPRPFTNVRWSSPDTLADTVFNLRDARVAFAATLSDVDDARDLARFGQVAARLVPAIDPSALPSSAWPV